VAAKGRTSAANSAAGFMLIDKYTYSLASATWRELLLPIHPLHVERRFAVFWRF
jgi:hypothetical protein